MCTGGFADKNKECRKNATRSQTAGHGAPDVNPKRIKKEKRGKTKDAIGGATSEPGVGEGGRRT
jgi:hypothetical protein